MKVAVIGAGNVGATVAECVVRAELADVVMLDIRAGLAKGKALDMMQAGSVLGFEHSVTGTDRYEDIAGAEVVVVTAGLARKPGMSRDDLLAKNAAIIREVSRNVAEQAPEAVLIMVTNPLDVMSWVAMTETGFPRRRVLGMAGVLDAARFSTFIAMELNCSRKDVNAMVLGGHGDSMVPLSSATTVRGLPVSQLIEQQTLEGLIDRTRKGGAEIVGLLETGSAWYAPGASAFEMVQAVLQDSRRIVPASIWTQGEYGLSDVFVGLPVVLGRNGLERVVELELTDDESTALKTSAEHVKSTMQKV